MEYRICDVSDLEERKPFAVRLNNMDVGVIRVKDQVFAYENVCPHLGGPVCLGNVFEKIKLKMNDEKMVLGEYTSEDELHLVCPWHGFEFDVKTGECFFDKNFKLHKLNAYVKEGNVFLDLA